jgi:alkylation response protein AidB-like acyl-CoA dehydrogenase
LNSEINDEQRLILDSLGRIIERSLPLHEQRRRDAAHEPPYDLLQLLGEAGVLRLPFPVEIGGLGGTWQTVALVQEYLGRHAWMLGSLFNRAVGFGGMGLMTYGSPKQREALMPRLMRGELLFALALTEPDAGSDAAAVTTCAKRTSNGWQLNGRKTWISDAEEADFMVVVARTDPDAHRSVGLTLFLVPKGTPGMRCTPIPKIGNNCLPSFEVDFTDVELAEDAVFGLESQGFANMASTLHYARAGMAASTTGYAGFALELALDHARTRQQFGRPLGAFQALAHRLANMQMRVDQSRLAAHDLAWRISNDHPNARQAAQAKVIATECLQYVTHHGMQILASPGYHADSDMARVWRDSRLYSFGEGSNEIQRNIIAKELGLGKT